MAFSDVPTECADEPFRRRRDGQDRESGFGKCLLQAPEGSCRLWFCCGTAGNAELDERGCLLFDLRRAKQDRMENCSGHLPQTRFCMSDPTSHINTSSQTSPPAPRP